MNRSNRRLWAIGSTRLIPSVYDTIELVALPRPWAGIPCSFAKRIRSQQMRKNSARPARSMTSSSWASRLTTGKVTGW